MQEVEKETGQMRKRIRYLTMSVDIPDEQREEVLHHCGHCTARLYLEGRATLDAPRPPPPPLPPPLADDQPQAKRQRTAQECLQELKDLKQLLDVGALDLEEFTGLKTRLLRGD